MHFSTIALTFYHYLFMTFNWHTIFLYAAKALAFPSSQSCPILGVWVYHPAGFQALPSDLELRCVLSIRIRKHLNQLISRKQCKKSWKTGRVKKGQKALHQNVLIAFVYKRGCSPKEKNSHVVLC